MNEFCEDIAGLNQEGERFFQIGDLERARICFSKALRIDADHSVTRNNLAVLCWQESDTVQALQHLARAVAVAPDNREFILNGMQMMLANGNEEEAEQLCSSYLLTNPQDKELADWLLQRSDDLLPPEDETVPYCYSVNQFIQSVPEKPISGSGKYGYEPAVGLLAALPNCVSIITVMCANAVSILSFSSMATACPAMSRPWRCWKRTRHCGTITTASCASANGKTMAPMTSASCYRKNTCAAGVWKSAVSMRRYPCRMVFAPITPISIRRAT